MTAEIRTLRNELIGAGRKLEPDDVLDGAKTNLTEVVVIGFDKLGEMYVASTEGPGDALWLIESAKMHLLSGGQE